LDTDFLYLKETEMMPINEYAFKFLDS